jgi:uncharacterized delta-60 repeat protein
VVINQVVVQADGKILVAGAFSADGAASRKGIMRLNADGSLDTGFDPGTGVNDENVDCVAIAPDGKIVIGGVFNAYNGTPRQRVARLNADGSLDLGFVPDAAAATNRVNAVAIQPDGKVLIGVAGSTIKRLNSDGSLDTGFTTTMVPQVGVIEIKLQSDGKVLIGGGWDFLNGSEYRFGLARLNTDGSTDTGFVPHQNDFNLYRAAIGEIIAQADGKVVAVGNLKINATGTGFNKHIVRFNADGTVDSSFDSGTDTNNTIFSVVGQPDGKYVIVGSFTAYNGTTGVNRVARLNANGVLDTTYHANVANNTIYSAARQADGKIIIAGYFTQVDSAGRTGLARLQSQSRNKAAICDYDGDGKTDYALRRIESQQFIWYVSLSSGGWVAQPWGRSGNQVVCGDFDADGKSDFAVWKTGATPTAGFYILQSSDNTVRFEQFGQSQDNPTVIGDFDGDGKSDVAVYRNGPTASSQSYFYYRGSLNNPNGDFTVVPWGIQFDRPYVGDFDGDGKDDFAVERTINGSAVHFILQSSTGTYRTVVFGNGSGSEAIVPGDYNGDGITDIAINRLENGNRYWYITTDLGATYSAMPFGTLTQSFTAVGDYDGDGKSDIAVYQNDTGGAGYNFFVKRSSDEVVSTTKWGISTDFPIVSYNSH